MVLYRDLRGWAEVSYREHGWLKSLIFVVVVIYFENLILFLSVLILMLILVCFFNMSAKHFVNPVVKA